MPKILISDSMNEIVQKIFKKNNIEFDVKTNLSEKEIISIIANYDALVVRSATKVTKNIIYAGKNLKIIGRAGAGVDNIDLNSAKEKNIIVMNTPGGNTNATAEHTLALILSLIRKIPYSNNTTHEGKWEKKNIKGIELSNKTFGIIGLGNVSIRLIELLKGFKMNIQVYSKSLEKRHKEFPSIKNIQLEKLLSTSDIISIHSKASSDGKPLINYNDLKKMKSSALIINTARGNIINEQDLNSALNENLISGAAIDVFSKEPANNNILFNNPKVIVTPHIAASTKEAQIIVAEMIANQISSFFINKEIINKV
tara:strand:- start:760 stop:1695 length:936 start_codon:yes stop_codon:yes gene_type:complete